MHKLLRVIDAAKLWWRSLWCIPTDDWRDTFAKAPLDAPVCGNCRWADWSEEHNKLVCAEGTHLPIKDVHTLPLAKLKRRLRSGTDTCPGVFTTLEND